ncbi:putative oxidoreductase YteT [Liolophura sinensis]|uniref:putative oxidoreductase YteT n=1 Tax=Liolophura sinensis TaxID=3198878 RepID=UPI003158C925
MSEVTRPATVVLVGCGVRGQNYASYALAHPDRLKIVGIAEPREYQRNLVKTHHGIEDDKVFTDWTSLVSQPKFADGVIIATHTRLHQAPAVAFAKKGYHMMQETPMALTMEGCQEVYNACVENQVMFCSCHVLRYSPAASKIKELIDSGAVGDVVNIQHIEMYGTIYSTHATVRGYHRRQEMCGAFVLAKSCHDLDLISYWMGDKKCTSLSAFGHLSHFTKANKPPEASNRCWECPVERRCPFSAIKNYIEPVKNGFTGFPVNNVSDVLDVEHVTEAIKTGPFGKCVYDMDNDVQNHLVIGLQFEDGATATHTVVAFSELNGTRETKIFGTMGEIRCRFGEPLQYTDFRTRKTTTYTLEAPGQDVPEPLKHYWGSDYNVIHCFTKALRENNAASIQTDVAVSLASHQMAFAADQALTHKTVVKL